MTHKDTDNSWRQSLRLSTASRPLLLAGVLGAAAVLVASALVSWWITFAALVVAAVGVGATARRKSTDSQEQPSPAGKTPEVSTSQKIAAAAAKALTPSDGASLVESMLTQKRYALLLRKQIVSNLAPEQFAQTMEMLSEGMSILPEGDVVLGVDMAMDANDLFGDALEDPRSRTMHVAGAYLDRYPVTNLDYLLFVRSGGYEQMAIWDPEIWPGVLNFVDKTGSPGPRFWCNSAFADGEENQPVIGVSWYEARAYARWIGKRLPTGAEWVKAASWPVELNGPTGGHMQRRFPWGDTMDRRRCNLWGSGPDRIVPVTDFSEGASAGGVYQMIGNVWEWTSSSFAENNVIHGNLSLPMPMRTIRGGAFDTYFDNHATCQFQSGESPIGRKHNIGFRCAVSICDLSLSQDAATIAQPIAEVAATTEELSI